METVIVNNQVTLTSPTPSAAMMETMSTDNDDVCSVDSYDSTATDEMDQSSPSNERDEYQEVEKSTQDDTIRLQLWRVVVTIVLLSCTLAVTVTTYYVLEAENEANFENAFDDIANIMAKAAVDQRDDLDAAIGTYAASLTAAAQAIVGPNQTIIPHIPYFESYGGRFRDVTADDVVSSLLWRVPGADRAAYETEMLAVHEDLMRESHLLAYGNLDAYDPTQYQATMFASASPRPVVAPTDSVYFPVYMNSPPTYQAMNWNAATSQLHNKETLEAVLAATPTDHAFMSAVVNTTNGEGDPAPYTTLPGDEESPKVRFLQPVLTHVLPEDAPSNEAVGILMVSARLDILTSNLLPENVQGIMIILHNTCGQSFTYVLDGSTVTYMGAGDMAEDDYRKYEIQVNLTSSHEDAAAVPGLCAYSQSIYPTARYREDFQASRTPKIFAVTVAVTFIMVALVFAVYDFLVNERNKKVVENAARSNAIVTQLFPGNLREQIVARKHAEMQLKKSNHKSSNFLRSFAEGKSNYDLNDMSSKPVAELFLNATIIFADIVGFTAWSSVREPAQVFTLLETVYSKFDYLAKRRRVFKVETVGDCYVAATGLPEPRHDHAVAMMRFAADILAAIKVVTRDLEVTLGPDTSDLDLRIGIHSGQVTAGVLRGERARLQLFGDTMNTAARIESTSRPGRIQLSKETGELVIQAGKGHWIEKRDIKVEAKGKGALETYWLKENYNRQTGNDSTESSGRSGQPLREETLPEASAFTDKTKRLIDWNVETLVRLLKQIIVRRKAVSQSRPPTLASTVVPNFGKSVVFQEHSDYLKEVKEIITFPEFDGKVDNLRVNLDDVKLPSFVTEQLKTYVSCIAGMYQDNAFHNFEHASHVLMSVTKLMGRIVAPSDLDEESADVLHDHTYGITSDPLTQFSCAFSALIHDVDHSGVPNATLIKENAEIAEYYKNRSVAEQNSLDLAWRLLMDPQFDKLRAAICDTEDELSRFRKLVVNSVMATDIVDKELKQLRNTRWDKAFHPEKTSVSRKESKRDAINRKATIVIEHLIQASDVAHTMQHWHVYRKWNERFFMECYAAYKSGRAEKDPSANWYEGELGFFDFYIIPLAKKLKECGVFGVSSGEYLDYARKNRQEWEDKGRDVVEDMLEKLSEK